MGWDKLQKSAEAGPLNLAAYVGIRFGIIVLLITAVTSTIGFVAYPLIQGRKVIEKTFDADNMIQNYEWFKLRYEDIGAIDGKISAAEKSLKAFSTDAGDRKEWHRIDREEHARLNAVAIGLRQQREDLAAEYNAKSRMMNRSIFKLGDTVLPERITP